MIDRLRFWSAAVFIVSDQSIGMSTHHALKIHLRRANITNVG